MNSSKQAYNRTKKLCYCSNRTLTAKFKTAITTITINIHDRILSGTDGFRSSTWITRTLTSSSISVKLIIYGEEKNVSNSTEWSQDVSKEFNKDDSIEWQDEDMTVDVYGDGHGTQGFETRWTSYTLIVDEITVVNNKQSSYSPEIVSETIRIGNIDYCIVYSQRIN